MCRVFDRVNDVIKSKLVVFLIYTGKATSTLSHHKQSASRHSATQYHSTTKRALDTTQLGHYKGQTQRSPNMQQNSTCSTNSRPQHSILEEGEVKEVDE